RDQPIRSLRAIAEQVRFGITGDTGGKGFASGRDLVDGRISQPGKGHSARVDAVALSAPFLRHRLRQRGIGQRQKGAGGRPYRAAVQLNFEARIARNDGGILVEAPHFGGRRRKRLSSRRGTIIYWNRPTMTKIRPIALALLPCTQEKRSIRIRM